MDRLLEVRNLTVEYDGQHNKTLAIKDINLNIDKSDFVVVLGPSGCGKTTLLNILAGFIEPTSGQVLLNSKPISGTGPDRGVVFQKTNLYPWLTIEQNILFGPTLNNKPAAETKELLDHCIGVIGLEEFKSHYPFELSGGMQQRVAIARTMINNPDLLLMDEPFAALDAINRSLLQKFIRTLWANEKFTVFMITHDIDEAMTLGNKVFVMSKNPGQIEKEFKLDFNQKILDDPNYIAAVDPKYLEIKREILRLLED